VRGAWEEQARFLDAVAFETDPSTCHLIPPSPQGLERAISTIVASAPRAQLRLHAERGLERYDPRRGFRPNAVNVKPPQDRAWLVRATMLPIAGIDMPKVSGARGPGRYVGNGGRVSWHWYPSRV